MIFGCCIPIKDYHTAVEAGFDFVEFSGTEIFSLSETMFDKTCNMVLEGAVPCISFNSYCQELPAMVGAAFNEKSTALYAERICSRASALGVKMIGIGAPRARMLPPDYDRTLADEQCRRFLRITADIALKYKVSINFEALNQYACQYGTSTEHVVKQIRAVGAPNLFLVVDFYHRYLAGEMVTDFSGYENLIRHIHISACEDDRRRCYPIASDYFYYKELFGALKAINYNGTVSIEAPSSNLFEQGREALNMLRLAGGHGGSDI